MKSNLLFIYKVLIIAALCFLSMQISAQEYTIQFAGGGSVNSVDSVLVENMMNGTTVKLAGNETLKLVNVPTSITATGINTPEIVKVFPNPVYSGTCKIQFYAPASDNSVFNLFDISGRMLFSKSIRLKEGDNSLSVSGLSSGIYLLRLISGNKAYGARIISYSFSSENIKLDNEETAFTDANGKIGFNLPAQAKSLSSLGNIVTMQYSKDDLIKFTGKHGNNRTIHVLKPEKNEVINFEFYACADVDGNNYPIVKIGNQTWMAENLRTTLYNDGTPITLIENQDTWSSSESEAGAYCWYDNNIGYRTTYGALYNGYAAMSQKLAPQGWHIPTKEDFEELFQLNSSTSSASFLIGDTAFWEEHNFPPYNQTGFSAVGAGSRNRWGFEGIKINTFFWTTTIGNAPSIKRKEIKSTLKAPTYSPYLTNAMLDLWNSNIEAQDALSGMSVRCIKNSPPTIKTGMVSGGRATSAGCEGIILNTGGEAITESGICWSSTNTQPTIADAYSNKGIKQRGKYTCLMTELEAGVTYYVRAYAGNTEGISYGEVKTVTTLDLGTVQDINGNSYNLVQIGKQIWMAEDLRVSKYNDGTDIPMVSDAVEWSLTTAGAYCKYNDTEPDGTYGFLYNQYAVQTNKLAPLGWHVPTETELNILSQTLVPDESESHMLGVLLKEESSAHWTGEYANGTNFSGFTALPGGYRDDTGVYLNKNTRGNWWTTHKNPSEDTYLYLNISNSSSYGFQTMKSGLSVRCLKDYPAVVTTYLKDVKQTSAKFGNSVSEEGGIVTRRGICWSSTEILPTVLTSQTSVVDFSVNYTEEWTDVNSLLPGTTYHLRAFAENSTGISYGEVITFSTQSAETVADADGNQYHTIKIGTQTWMVENLRTTKYNDGTSISGISGYHSTTPGYSVYANTSSNKQTYGLLYNWYAVNTGKLAPEGWRIPTKADWETLIAYLGGNEIAGGKLKESGLTHWESPNTEAVDYGFVGLAGGTRDGGSATFRMLRSRGYWWSSSTSSESDYNAMAMGLVSWSSNAYMYESYESDAFSVRCIKNE